MIDIAADLLAHADRYTASARAVMDAAPAPLPDLETARAELLEQLADVDRRITARTAAEKRCADLARVAARLRDLAGQHQEETAPPPAPVGDALAAALRAGGEQVPVPSPLSPETARWSEDGASEPLGEPVAGHATTQTRPEPPQEPRRERPFPGEGVPGPLGVGGGDGAAVAPAHRPPGGGVTQEEQTHG
ncbi:hypothetical protein SAMN04489712_105250 [Thermomonospora echinospora]|uniref:Uncharacterized protein n=1 Tax=Thermomonospora echinospora TaxID=1992 RepID=A0A1H6A8P1_9ACTN|nr:hypothetical protein [Thermomonospora echinospora]SEG44405.1 hypothetical protein SAMN04489712_105250 [Thermomonospora echinospora]